MNLFAITSLAIIYIWLYTTMAMQYVDNIHKEEEIDCKGRRKQLNFEMIQARCMPISTLVKLMPKLGYTIYPNYASVKRCNGYCPQNKSCMPIVKYMKKIAVRVTGNKSNKCYHIFVEEHIKCKCDCDVMESHCNALQMYSEDTCTCECMNREECSKAQQMVWDEKSCKCTCNKSEEICASGTEWVPALCRCAIVMDMPDNSFIEKVEDI